LLLARPALALDGGRYGEVHVATPSGQATGYVVLFSDLGGWTAADEADLTRIADAGAIAVGVDTPTYYKKLAGDGQGCDQLVGDAEGLSRQIQHGQTIASYAFPILAGRGEGGALAQGILAEAPGHTFSGAVAIEPAASLHAPHKLCPGPPDAPFGFSETGKAGALLDLLTPHLAAPVTAGVAALPLEELPSAVPGRLMAVVLSGDGGWRDLDKVIAEDLQADGVSVVGWDCLRYFWQKRTAEETAVDLAQVLEVYGARWHADRFALVGYSFGADVLPATYILLPEALKRRVVLVSLLALSPKADWQISVLGWLGAPPTASALPVEPALAEMPVGILQCFYGEAETDALCPDLASRGVEVVKTAGGHHFNNDYAALARQILDRFRLNAGG
jgi:type IV secretory pathway VirJ component